jgi:hypothetical protein
MKNKLSDDLGDKNTNKGLFKDWTLTTDEFKQ